MLPSASKGVRIGATMPLSEFIQSSFLGSLIATTDWRGVQQLREVAETALRRGEPQNPVADRRSACFPENRARKFHIFAYDIVPREWGLRSPTCMHIA